MGGASSSVGVVSTSLPLHSTRVEDIREKMQLLMVGYGIRGVSFLSLMYNMLGGGYKEYYRIALIFRGSKFSRITVLKEFVKKILWMRIAHGHDSSGRKVSLN